MKRRWVAPVAIAAGIVALGVALGSPPSQLPSARSSAPSGLAVAARYLAESGREVELLDEPPSGEGNVVVALPALRPWTEEEALELSVWVARGGTVTILASTAVALPDALARAFNLTTRELPRIPVGSFGEWRDRVDEVRAASGPHGRLVGGMGRWRVECPTDFDASWHAADRSPRVCSGRHGRGRVAVVNDVSPLWNSQLAVADHLVLLEQLFPAETPVWFEESHHAAAVGEEAAYAGQLDAVLAQAALVYLLVAWQRARPLGPKRPLLRDREPGLVSELRTLGRLHASGGHGLDAARRLVEMARGRYAGDERLTTLPEAVDAMPQALALGRRLAELERRTT